MTSPANWPTDRLVYPQEAFRLAAEGMGLRPTGGYMPSARVAVRDANGQMLREVIAIRVDTGEVHHPVKGEHGEYLTGPDGVRVEAIIYPAPLQITYGEQ
jgi:putative NIF3 family GTP cyclohydrolase 1 type 2